MDTVGIRVGRQTSRAANSRISLDGSTGRVGKSCHANPTISLWPMAPTPTDTGCIQPPAGFGSRQARSKGSRHAWGATN
jgi:hypothetical protein